MKRKLTLTIDEAVIAKGKAYAHSHGRSLSQIVEERLSAVAEAEPDDSFERWLGIAKGLPQTDTGDDRYDRLAKRYLNAK